MVSLLEKILDVSSIPKKPIQRFFYASLLGAALWAGCGDPRRIDTPPGEAVEDQEEGDQPTPTENPFISPRIAYIINDGEMNQLVVADQNAKDIPDEKP